MLSSESFVALGTSNTVAVDDSAALTEAAAMVRSMIQEIDLACSRFRDDSELSRLNRAAGHDVAVSPLLEEAIVAGFRSAQMTGGLVDLTVGRSVEEAGYTVTFRDMAPDGPPLELRVRRAAGWQAVGYDEAAHTVHVPEGTSLDLGASGKAWAADRAAAAVAKRLGVGVLVDCGGDVAVAGPPPAGGWTVRVAEDAGSPVYEDVSVFDGGLATSGVTARRWRRGGVELHHIIDPATGLPADTPWAFVSVAAATCLEANAAATAALIKGREGAAWLESLNLPGRLVDAAGAIRYTGGWGA